MITTVKIHLLCVLLCPVACWWMWRGHKDERDPVSVMCQGPPYPGPTGLTEAYSLKITSVYIEQTFLNYFLRSSMFYSFIPPTIGLNSDLK